MSDTELPMPSDVKPAAAPAGGEVDSVGEPPSAKLVVRLFLIPLIIVALAVGVMFFIGMMAGGTPTSDEAIAGLRQQGGQRTMDVLLGPGSKQRYLYAKAIIDQMKLGMNSEQRVKLSADLIDILENHTRPDEGEIRHLILLSLGRVWQKPPGEEASESTEAIAVREKTARTLLKYADDAELAAKKAALLATAYWAGRTEVELFIPKLLTVVQDKQADLDVRLAAATALGPIAKPSDQQVISTLQSVMRTTDDPREIELVWSSALSLAQLRQNDVADTIAQLLDRYALGQFKVYDRETDPRNPAFRTLSDREIERILINAMEGARHLEAAGVREQIRNLAQSDPSDRVKYAAKEIVQSW